MKIYVKKFENKIQLIAIFSNSFVTRLWTFHKNGNFSFSFSRSKDKKAQYCCYLQEKIFFFATLHVDFFFGPVCGYDNKL